MVKTTRAQREALYKIWQRTIHDKPNPLTYREFRKTVTPGLGYIMVPWAGMWLGIEPDGYTHS
jgi:hypothetical protein